MTMYSEHGCAAVNRRQRVCLPLEKIPQKKNDITLMQKVWGEMFFILTD